MTGIVGIALLLVLFLLDQYKPIDQDQRREPVDR